MAPLDPKAIVYQPKPRPEWAREFIDIGNRIDARSVVPLDEASLLRAARENTGLEDFGDDDWIEPFRILLDDLEHTAKLHLFGRVMTRSDLLIHPEGRLRVVDWLKRHPEVEREVIEAPVFIIGLPRSGTTIMQEILGADPNARTVRMWEAKFPVPPPAPGDLRPDPRIAQAQDVVGLQDLDRRLRRLLAPLQLEARHVRRAAIEDRHDNAAPHRVRRGDESVFRRLLQREPRFVLRPEAGEVAEVEEDEHLAPEVQPAARARTHGN